LINNQVRRKQIDKDWNSRKKPKKNIMAVESEDDYKKYEKLEETRRKRREQREYENYAWHKFAAKSSPERPSSRTESNFCRSWTARQFAPTQQWKARTAAFEIRSDGEGLYKITAGERQNARRLL
jgi:hypothetical protein